MLDRRTTLCLACSSSLPPNVDDSELFITKCCERPICPRCLETNPRLARYNPCLACLAAVGVIQASSFSGNRPGRKPGAGDSGVRSVKVENLDGGVKDRDLFALGDGDEESDEDDDTSVDGEEGRRFPRSAAPPPPDVIHTTSPLPKTPPPPSVTIDAEEQAQTTNATPVPLTPSDDERSPEPYIPAVYRLRKGDTLMGIALRFRLDVCLPSMDHVSQFILTDRDDQAMELCRLNSLPTTTLSTTPHILHTRTTILLPPTSKPPPEDPALAETRRVERAEKRLQTVTKETDWRVAKAYIALAQGSDPHAKEKPDNWNRGLWGISGSVSGGSSQKGGPENDAIEQYLEDSEWEEQERKDGRGPVMQQFPWGSFGQKSEQGPTAQQESSGFKWPWSV